MSTALICASHSPLFRDGAASEQQREEVASAFARLASFVREFEPDLVVQFGPDHFNGFFYDVMPSFCVGVGAESLGDWGTSVGPLPVPEETARELADHLVDCGIDAAVSYRMKVDHGFAQVWDLMMGEPCPYPVIPIFVNCAAPPLPTYKRARALGTEVGRWAAKAERRVLFAASGGLSHDPPIPDIRSAPAEVRERLIDGRNTPAKGRAEREAHVLAVGNAAARGEAPILPLNPAWDQQAIEAFIRGDLDYFAALSTDQVREVAGRGGNETLAWVAALTAHLVTGPSKARLEFYAPITGWIAGMALMTAEQA